MIYCFHDYTLDEARCELRHRQQLVARLDQMGAAKGTAQLAATIGQEFGFALLRAVASIEEETLRQDLRRLVEAELLYQRGVGAQATGC